MGLKDGLHDAPVVSEQSEQRVGVNPVTRGDI
jgi:hypothetical protein